MPVVQIDQISNAVDQSIKEFVNGLVRQKKKGIQVDVQGTKLDFTFTVIVPGGLNAITRTVKVTPDEKSRVSTTVEPDTTEVTVKGIETTETNIEESGGTVKEVSASEQNTNNTQETVNGRTTTTTLEYEE